MLNDCCGLDCVDVCANYIDGNDDNGDLDDNDDIDSSDCRL